MQNFYLDNRQAGVWSVIRFPAIYNQLFLNNNRVDWLYV